MTQPENGGKVIAVKNWHVVLTLVSWLVLAVGSYATQKAMTQAQLDDLTRRVQQLETERVSKPEFDMAVQDIERRLTRIEDKLDRAALK